MSGYCYHYEIAEGVCAKCATPVTVTPGHSVRVAFGTADNGYPVWVEGAEAPSVVEAVALALGVEPSAVALVDVTTDGVYYERRMRARFTLRGSKVEVVARVTVSDEERHDPERTELGEDGRPVTAPEAVEA